MRHYFTNLPIVSSKATLESWNKRFPIAALLSQLITKLNSATCFFFSLATFHTRLTLIDWSHKMRKDEMHSTEYNSNYEQKLDRIECNYTLQFFGARKKNTPRAKERNNLQFLFINDLWSLAKRTTDSRVSSDDGAMLGSKWKWVDEWKTLQSPKSLASFASSNETLWRAEK